MNTASNLMTISVNFWEDGASLLVRTLESHTVSVLVHCLPAHT